MTKTDLTMHKLVGDCKWVMAGELKICKICGKVKGERNSIKKIIDYINELFSQDKSFKERDEFEKINKKLIEEIAERDYDGGKHDVAMKEKYLDRLA